MKKIIFLVLLVFDFCISAFAAEDEIVGIKADKSEEIFKLSEMLNIKVKGGKNASMSVNKIDGTTVDGFQTIVFNYDLSNVDNNSVVPSIQMYPNPVENIIYVSGLEKDADIKVVATDGKTVKQVIGQQVEVSDLAKGIYLLSVDGRMVKFIKK